MDHWLYHTAWLGNSTLAWVIAVGGALLGYAVAHSVAVILGARLGSLAKRTQRPSIIVAAAVVKATRGWLLLLIAISVALEFLHLTDTAKDIQGTPHYLRLATGALIGIQLAFWASALLVTWLRQSASRDNTRPANPVMLGVVTWAVQLVVWITLVLALLSTSGVNITAFVASLGVGGVAVALALQNVLGDLFASISIGLDQPFEVGDNIAFGDVSGTVRRVGIKTTRIDSLSGEQLVISNSDLLKKLVHNYGRMQERRVVFGFRVPYTTSRKEVEAIVERVRTIIAGQDKVRLDRGHLRVFGEYGFDFEFVYFVLDPGYTVYCDVQQRINLEIMAALEERGVGFAIPARNVRVDAPDAASVLPSIG